LQRWKLDEAKLPSGCEVLGQPSTRSALPLAIFVGVILLQLALISALVLQSRRRARAEAQARLRGAELAHASRLSMMGVLTASIAHEINQPLGAILSNADAADIMLERGKFDVDRLRAIVTDIRKEDQRAGDVVRGLRAMMRKREMQLKPVDVNVETADALHSLAYEAARRKVHLTPEFALDVPIVMADPVHLHQVLVNLLVNAMEALESKPPGGREVRVRTRADRGGAEIAVMDSGPGLPAGREQEVFDSFFTTKSDGMGVGLSIVRTIIEAHGGRVSAGTAALGGAQFGVWLPAAGT
jgi:C4-dicarboxylate-specific signal transduction histidine kinase